MITEYANRLTARGHQVTLAVPGGTLDPDVLDELAPDVNVRQSRVARGSHLNIVQMIRFFESCSLIVVFDG